MIKTTKEEIAEYWQLKFPDKKLSSTNCWRCGIKKRLDRCHIQAASRSGEDHPENFVLLCKHCHIDSPNIENPEFIWEWLDYYNSRDYEKLWYDRGVREFEMMYGVNLRELVSKQPEVFESFFEENLVFATRHFGQPSLNPATVAGVIKESLYQMGIVVTLNTK